MIKTPLKKVEKTPATAILYLFLMILSHIFIVLFVISDIQLSDTLILSTHASFGLSILCFCLCWLRDPGYLEADPSMNFFDLIERFDANHLCPDC